MTSEYLTIDTYTYAADKYSYPPIVEASYFVKDRYYYRGPQLVKMPKISDHVLSNSKGQICSVTLWPRLRVNHGRSYRKIIRSMRLGHLLRDSVFYKWWGNKIHELSTIWLPEQDQHKYNISCHDKVDGKLCMAPPLVEELQAIMTVERWRISFHHGRVPT